MGFTPPIGGAAWGVFRVLWSRHHRSRVAANIRASVTHPVGSLPQASQNYGDSQGIIALAGFEASDTILCCMFMCFFLSYSARSLPSLLRRKAGRLKNGFTMPRPTSDLSWHREVLHVDSKIQDVARCKPFDTTSKQPHSSPRSIRIVEAGGGVDGKCALDNTLFFFAQEGRARQLRAMRVFHSLERSPRAMLLPRAIVSG